MAPGYYLQLSPAAEREVRRLIREVTIRVRNVLRTLAEEPRPPGCRKLSGFDAVWRVRSGRLRIIYEVDDDSRRIIVLRVVQRDERTYRRL